MGNKIVKPSTVTEETNVSSSLSGLRPVVVTTKHRGVFFGWAADTSGDTITLRRARNCIYWSSAVGGFMGLAATGPMQGSRVGARVEQMILRDITAVLEASDEATKMWEAANVYRG